MRPVGSIGPWDDINNHRWDNKTKTDFHVIINNAHIMSCSMSLLEQCVTCRHATHTPHHTTFPLPLCLHSRTRTRLPAHTHTALPHPNRLSLPTFPLACTCPLLYTTLPLHHASTFHTPYPVTSCTLPMPCTPLFSLKIKFFLFLPCLCVISE